MLFSFQGESGRWGPFSKGREPERGPVRQDFTDTGLTIFLVSLTIVFVAAGVGHLMVRMGQEEWGNPWNRKTLTLAAIATACLFLVDGLHSRARRCELARTARFWLACSLAIVGGYLLVQFLQWQELGESIRLTRRPEFVTLAILSALHAIHVVGGLLATGWVGWRLGIWGKAPEVSLARLSRYWRFLTWVWLALLVCLGWR